MLYIKYNNICCKRKPHLLPGLSLLWCISSAYKNPHAYKIPKRPFRNALFWRGDPESRKNPKVIITNIYYITMNT